jgi:cytochrome c-type biogenesis protein
MVNDLFTWLNSLLEGNVLFVLTGAFIWGVMSILLSPCHLSTVPLVIGFVVGNKGSDLKSAFNISLVFAGGILITIALIGLVTASAGRILGDIGTGSNYIIPIVLLITGLFFLDVLKLRTIGFNAENYKTWSYWKIFILGIVIGAGLGPCTFAFMAPVLGVVFQFAAVNMLMVIFVLLLFAIGHCSVIVAAGTLSKKVQIYLNWNENSNAVSKIKKVLGSVAILSSLYLFGAGF